MKGFNHGSTQINTDWEFNAKARRYIGHRDTEGKRGRNKHPRLWGQTILNRRKTEITEASADAKATARAMFQHGTRITRPSELKQAGRLRYHVYEGDGTCSAGGGSVEAVSEGADSGAASAVVDSDAGSVGAGADSGVGSAEVGTSGALSMTDSVCKAASPSAAGFSVTGFFSGLGGLGNGFLAVSMRPSANSRTCP